ncbi:MAG: hypothetical protein AAGH90_07135 [Pseudomonadota bacterium]
MQWLISQIWILLAVAAVLGLILGLALRGLMSAGKMRKATVERDVARTELSQARSEIDALYASQRKMKEEGVVTVDTSELDAARADLSKRESQIAELQIALQAARDDAEAAQKATDGNTLQTAGAAVAGAVGGALLGGDDDKLKELEDRNVWLEERVVTLEADLEQATVTQSSDDHSDHNTPVLTIPETTSETGVSTAKLEWQNAYLRRRVEALEDRMQISAAVAPTTEEAELTVTDEPTDASQSDEELARLRWRNRYLEGRLAYYEDGNAGDADDTADSPSNDDDDDEGGLIAETVVTAGAVAGATLLSDNETGEEEAPEEPAETVEVDPEIETESADDTEEGPGEDDISQDESDTHQAVSEEEHVAETILKSLDESENAETEEPDPAEDVSEEDDNAAPEEEEDVAASEDADQTSAQDEPEIIASSTQPVTMSKPKDGGDDLTTITGIGPRIAEVLNGLGIWQYDQIADWQPEHSAWIDEHLSFKGRVEREQWVEQARALVENKETSSD